MTVSTREYISIYITSISQLQAVNLNHSPGWHSHMYAQPNPDEFLSRVANLALGFLCLLALANNCE